MSDWSSDVCSSGLDWPCGSAAVPGKGPAAGRASGTAVQLGHDELAVLQRLGGGEPAVAGSERDVDQRIARLIEIHLAAQDAGDVEIDVLAHLARRLRVGGQLAPRLDREIGRAAGRGRVCQYVLNP